MALDLFANFERYSNNPSFYRVTSSTSTFAFKLDDLSSNQNLATLYTVQSSVNNGPYSTFNPNGNGQFVTNLSFNTNTPCVCAFNTKIFSQGVLLSSIALSARFVSSFPSVNFVTYPSGVIDEYTNVYHPLNSTNYTMTSGMYFYGEGHTEIVNLSASGIPNGGIAKWYVGNAINNISNNISELSVLAVTPSTAQVSVSSVLSDERHYPVSLWATNSVITTAGPFKTYNDSTGVAQFYPFFSSTIDLNGDENRTLTKGSIYVKQYPYGEAPVFTSPFPAHLFNLPLDYKLKPLLGIISYAQTLNGFLQENIISTKWKLEAYNKYSEWSVETDTLSTILAYKFLIGYDDTFNDSILPFLKSSANVHTNISLTVTACKEVFINEPPYDWTPKHDNFTFSSAAIVGPLPYSVLYTPNYFNIKGENVAFSVVVVPPHPLGIKTLTIESPQSSAGLTLSANSLSGNIIFEQTGIVDLTITTILTSTATKVEQKTIVGLQNVMEIINRYEDNNNGHFQTALTPLKLTYPSLPQLSPNEWAIADNVNSIIEKIYTTIEDLNYYTKLYSKKDMFYAWFGPGQSETFRQDWRNLDCADVATENTATWAEYEGDGTDSNVTWAAQECDGNVCTPTHWKVVNIDGIDTGTFAIPDNSSIIANCPIIDVEVDYSMNQMFVAYPTEITMLNNGYHLNFFDRESKADDVFSFQNVVGLTTNKEGKILVLDSIIPRVSVFIIVNNKFVLFNAWGSFGLKTNKLGLNSPQDIHVDEENSVWIADTGNSCIKKYTIVGKHLLTITHNKLDTDVPISVCVDSQLNVHCLTVSGVIVFDQYGNYAFEYKFPANITGVKKINTSYNREAVYITYLDGVVKYFRTGVISHYTLQQLTCADGSYIQNYAAASQDKFRNLYVSVNDKVLKISDLQRVEESKAALPVDLYWNLEDLMVHKEEYIQPWVYLKSFHRLWDNIELMRSSLFYDLTGCRAFYSPTYAKTDLIIGQNELVTNATINRLSEQLWTNMSGLINYFDPNCEN